MLTEQEIRERETIAVLDLLQIAKRLSVAHSKLIMRHFTEARELLLGIKTRIDTLLDIVPEEEDG